MMRVQRVRAHANVHVSLVHLINTHGHTRDFRRHVWKDLKVYGKTGNLYGIGGSFFSSFRYCDVYHLSFLVCGLFTDGCFNFDYF